MAGKVKRPQEGAAGRIAPRDTSAVSFQDEPPKFSLRYVHPDYCVSACDKEDQLQFIQSMLKRKDMSWKALITSPHNKLGCETIRTLNVPVPDCAKGKDIISFRFSGKKAMVGFRERDVFYIIWFDRSFTVYSH
jgi:hypothetical protein